MCIAKTLIMDDTNEAKIKKKIEESLLMYNIHSKDLIAEKISMAGADDPRTKGRVKAIVDSRYKNIVSPLISDMIRELIPNQEVDSREIISTVQKERYELDTVSISKLFSKELKAYQAKRGNKLKHDLEVKRRMGKGADIKRDSRAPGAKTAVEKMNLIVSREKNRKEDFIQSIGEIAFKLSETY